MSATEIFGDFIAWSATTDPGQILVWNWKTSDVLLRLTPSADVSCFKFLDDSHLLVLDRTPCLCIYDFPQPEPEDHPITLVDCPCVLRLPPIHLGVMILKKKLHMQSTSSSSSSTAPMFRHDPDRKIVCVTLELKPRADQVRPNPNAEYYMFLFPVSALLSQFHRVQASVLSTRFKPRPVPWDKWGPACSRVLRTALVHAGVSGTKVVTVSHAGWDKTDKHPLYRLSVLDTNPFAVRARNRSAKRGVDPMEPEEERNDITIGRAFKGAIFSHLPYAVTLRRDIVLHLEEGANMRQMHGWHELLVFEDQWAFLYQERLPQATHSGFVSTGVYTFQI
ncbi:hypothetical protein V8D89_007702 [Ganoderma adspersum]